MTSFHSQVADFVAKTKTRQDLVIRKLGANILSSIVMLSPVDTGLFRGNWQVTLNGQARGVLKRTDKAGTQTISRGVAVLNRAKIGDKIHINNNLPYAIPLEYGWSKQAPNGMVRITFARFQSMLNKAVREAKAQAK